MEVTVLQTLKAVRCTSASPMVTQIRELHRSFKNPPKKSNNKNKMAKTPMESPLQKLLSTTQYRFYPPPSSPPERQWCPPETRGLSGMPIFKRAALFRKNVAICDTDGSFIYEDIYHRSVKLSVAIQDAFKARRSRSQPSNRRVAILCPNGASFLVAQFATWMSGGAAVPLLARGKMTGDQLEHCVQDAECDVVVAAEPQVDRIFPICKRHGQILIPLERSWWTSPKKESEFNFQLPLPEMPGDMEERFSIDLPALVLYGHDSVPGRVRKVELTHANVSHQSDSVAKAWDLNSNCSLLNALPLNSTYGVCSALAAPLAVGGRVVMLSQFDATNVWALLLGIGVNDEDKPWPKVNLFPSTPWLYRPLLEKHAEAFSGAKEKEFVKYKLKKRMRAFVSSLEPLSTQMREDWMKATGFSLRNCYTTLEAGTLMSEPIIETAEEKKMKDKKDINSRATMQLLPGVSSRIVRYVGEKNIKQEILDQNGTSSKPCTGQLVVRTSGSGRVIDGNRTVQNSSWLNTEDTVRMANGKFEILNEN